jgi:SAM-dependent methyltransferase
MHAIAFYDWDYHVDACDISEGMVSVAHRNAGNRHIKLFQAGFTELDKSGGMYDAVTCLGNSLPHVLSDEELDKSLECMKNVLLPGGILIIHGNNYDRILVKRERFMPLAEGERKGKTYLFVRFFDFLEDALTFNMVVLTNKGGRWAMLRDSATHRPVTCALLEERLKKAGFVDIKVWGAYPDEPFDRTESDNLIVVARKPHNEWSNPRGEPVTAIDRVPIRETGEPLADVKSVLRDADFREEPTLLRKTVAEMLAHAESLLPPGHRFYIKCAYRSIARQTEMYKNFYQELVNAHPEWPQSRVRREINKFLAPPDAKHPPGHSTGAAVDLTILGPDGVELDMVSAIHPEENGMANFPTYSRGITPAAAKNRERFSPESVRTKIFTHRILSFPSYI